MTNVANIRSLFLHPLPSYPIAEAAVLLGMELARCAGVDRVGGA
jgi:hypothetical protein